MALLPGSNGRLSRKPTNLNQLRIAVLSRPNDPRPGDDGGGGDGGPLPADFNPNVYNGERVCLDSGGATYLVMGGRARWIPDEPTYLGLFGDNWGRYQITPQIIGAMGGGGSLNMLLPGTILVKTDEADATYLVDLGKKRWITSETVFDRYGFLYDNVKHIPTAVINQLPDGAPIDEDWH
jgi:hypothetical protein